MNQNKTTYDWMLVTVRGYDKEKGYIYGNRHPDGKGVIVAKKHNVSRDWVKSLSNEKDRTFTPPQSVIAVYGAEEKDEKSGFTIASWATPVSKNLGQEDVYVTPIKISNKPKKLRNQRSGKDTYIDAVVLDQRPVEVRSPQDIRDTALSMLSGKAPTSLGLDGNRGFMIRIGHTAPDGSLGADSWEFFGRSHNTPEQTWNYYWNQPAAPGRQKNILQAVLTGAQSAFNDPNSYVEIVGCSRVLINDFGDAKRVNDLAALPNYKTTDNQNRTVASYALAAITVEKMGTKRIIKNQVPLPKNKIVNHIAGVLGNHVPGVKMPVAIKPMVDNQQPKQQTSPNANNANPNSIYPLSIKDYVNEDGEVNSFRVYGSKEALEKYKDAIESSAGNIKPFRARGELAYSFPLRFKKQVEASLSALTGNSPLYIKQINTQSGKFLSINGDTDNPKYKNELKKIHTRLAAQNINGQLLVPEQNRAVLFAELAKLQSTGNTVSVNASSSTNTTPQARPNTQQVARQQNPAPTNRMSFSDWQQSKFRKDPYAMMDSLDGYISDFAEQAGIDWGSAKDAVDFGTANQKGKLVKSSTVRPIDKAHRGSVAMAAHVKEKSGNDASSGPDDSIVWFKINFFNKKTLKDDVISFDAYPYLKDEYDRDVKNGALPNRSDRELEEIKKQNEARREKAKKDAEQQAQKDQQSRTYWARTIPTMPPETGSNQYFPSKGITHILPLLDARSGQDNNGKYSIISVHDMNFNFTGAQRIYENYWADDKGRRTNKNFIQGTLFKDDATDLPYGSHKLVGTIDPSKPIIFCEGVADSGTDYAATGLPVAICLNKGNLYHVVGLYRQKYPNTRLIIASDNDFYDIKKGNVGFAATLDAARDHGAEYTIPSFKGLSTESKPTDFNDLEKLAGIDVVRSQFRNIRVPPADLLEFHKLKTQVIGLDKLNTYLSTATSELVAQGNHGADTHRIRAQLILQAISAYGQENVASVINDDLSGVVQANGAVQAAPEREEKGYEFPVSIREHEGASGKKSCLVIDHQGGNSEKIEDALKKIVGEKYFPFNSHLGGWVAPYPIMRLLNTYLHDLTGAPQLYVGQSRGKASGTQFVVRGDFSDNEFLRKVSKSIQYAQPSFKKSQFGLVIPDSKAMPYIRETLRPYLVSNKDLDIAVKTPEIPEPQLNDRKIDEAVRLSGQGRGEIILSHISLQFQDSSNIFLDDDYAFSSVYSRVNKALSHLEPDVRHKKSLEESCTSIRAMLKAGIADTAVSNETIQRLNELVTHLEFTLDRAPIDSYTALSPQERIAVETTAERHGDEIENIAPVILGEANGHDVDRAKILATYQSILADIVESDSTNETPDNSLLQEAEISPEQPSEETPQENTADTKASDVLKENVSSPQVERITKLLEIANLAVEKGFDEEDLYDLFITQAGSPYFNTDNDTFNDIQYRQDLKYLSSDTTIPGWQNTAVNSTSQLFYAIYGDVARERVGKLEDYMDSYFGANGVTHWKTFEKYFSGKQSFTGELENPYLMEGEVDYDVIAKDLEYLTNYTSIHEYYRGVSEVFEQSQESSDQQDIFGEELAPKESVEFEIIVESSKEGLNGLVKSYSIDGSDIYEICVSDNRSGLNANVFNGFNIYMDVSLDRLQHAIDNAGIDESSYEHGTKGSVSVSIVAEEKGDSFSIQNREIDTGPTSFFQVRQIESHSGVETISDLGVFRTYQEAAEAYQNHYSAQIDRFTKSTIEPVNTGEEPVKENKSRHIGELMSEWARRSEPFEKVRNNLQLELGITLDGSHIENVRTQYELLVSKISNENGIKIATPEQRYGELQSVTLRLARSELTYDEYVEELFRADGNLVEDNPYWNPNTSTVDRHAAFVDIQAAGYQSLAQFYESTFESIHNRTSTQLSLSRTGGYIPNEFDAAQPLRPQFENIEGLFSEHERNRFSKLPPFNDWVESSDAYRVTHPILLEDLDSINAQDFSENYERDALLMIADIHGISVNPESTSLAIAESILKCWSVRSQLSALSPGEVSDLPESDVTQALEELNISSGGSKREKENRLLGHLDDLKAISKLRVAQYSYVNALIEMERNEHPIPNYALRAVSQFIHNETEFLGSASKAVEQADDAQLRINVENAVNLATSISPVEKAISLSLAEDRAQIVGIDSNKKSALVFSDKYDERESSAAKYTHRYALVSSESSQEIALPPHISHFAKFSSEVIATPVPIDSAHLLANNLRPVSPNAVSSVLSPLERWMDKFGYAGFIGSDGIPIIAVNNGKTWDVRKLSGKENTITGTYKNPNNVLTAIAGSITGFVDRDAAIEAWIDMDQDSSKDVMDQLRNIDSTSIDIDIDKITQLLENDDLAIFIDEHTGEGVSTKIDLIASGLLNAISDDRWEAIVSGAEYSLKYQDIAKEFLSAFNEVHSPAAETYSEPLYLLTPMEVSKRVDSMSDSDYPENSPLISEAYSEHYLSLSNQQKHLLATDIAAGTYESIGHFIHECEVRKALEQGLDGAAKISEEYYPDSNVDVISDLDNSVSSKGDQLVLIRHQDSDKFTFGFVSNKTEHELELQEVVFGIEKQDVSNAPADTEGLISSTGVYMPAMSFEEFKKLDEAYAPPAKHLDIDPRTQSGQEDLIKLSKAELVDYALVLGANHKGNRVDIINSISDLTFARGKISSGITDTANDLSSDDIQRICNVVGDFNKERDPIDTLNRWLSNNNEHIASEISLRNFHALQSSAATRQLSEGIYSLGDKNTFNLGTIDVTPINDISYLSDFNDISSVKDIEGLLHDESDYGRGYALLKRLGATQGELHSLIAAIPDNYVVQPIFSQEGFEWRLSDPANGGITSIYSETKELLEALREAKPDNNYFFGEGQFVAWLDENQVKTGHIATDSSISSNDKVAVTYTDQSRGNFVQELQPSQFITIPDDQFQTDYNEMAASFSGDASDLVNFFEEKLNGTDNEDLYSEIRKQFILEIAKQQSNEMDKHNHLIPSGYAIYQEGNEYSLKATGSDNEVVFDLNNRFETPSELARNIAIQQRTLISEDNTNARAKVNPNPSQSMGTDSTESFGNDASNGDEKPADEQKLASNVINIARPNRKGDGGDDEPPHDPTPGPGGGGISSKSKSSAADSTTSTGNSVSRSAPRTRGVSFQLASSLESEVSQGPNHRKHLNLEALKLRKELLDSGQEPSKEQKEVLSRYTGWGGLSSIFSQYGYDRSKSELINSLEKGEYDQLKRSVLTAFYTPPSITSAIWSAVAHMGFEGGKILDPSTGTGQFIGASPEDIANSSTFIAKELDSVSASLAKLIYGNESVQQEPYEKAKLPNNYFDLAISNIPFGDIRVFDSEYKKHNFRIHDYFFSKSLDKVKPGGLVAFVTSTGTMDKKDSTIREHLYEKADLIGAIRLPRKTFSSYAGTDVNADVIFLQKRPNGAEPKDGSWVWAIDKEYEVSGQEESVSLPINRYFIDNPSMIIGDVVAVVGRHGPELATSYTGESSIAEEIRSRINALPDSVFLIQTEAPKNEIYESINLESKETLKPGNFTVQNGAVGVVSPEFIENSGSYENKFVPLKLTDSDRLKLASMVEIRELTKAAINIQLSEYPEEKLHDLQSNLTEAYDRFYQSYGPLNAAKNRRLFSPDPDAPLLLALEKPGEDKDTYVKTDIFTQATIRKNTIPQNATSAEEALNISLGIKGKIDEKYISHLLGQSWDDIANQLDNRIYLDPRTNEWQPKEQYLSGNIGEKLSYASDAAAIDEQFDRNVNALNEVMPSPIPSYDIKVRLGATWIPVDDISRFIAHIVRGNDELRDPQEKYSVSQFGGNWVVRADNWELSTNEGRAYQEWGTKRLSAVDLIEKALNNRQIVVRDKLDDGSTIVNRDETIAANQKADALNTEFRQWIWSDPDRLKRLENLYNNRYNVYVEPKYSGDSIRLDGISPSLKGKPLEARESQKAAIQRYIFDGRSLNAHPVGAGKTLELVGSAMEGKRLGIHSKPLIVVPNNILSQFGRMALELYPAANALVIDPKQLSKNARKEFTAKIATSDWDMVVIAQSSFDKIATPPEHQKAVIEHEKYKLEEALNDLSNSDNRAAQLTVKRLERSLDNLETKIEELVDSDKKDNFLYLNEIGVDALFVDEADNYLNLFTPTQMSHVPGVNTSSSQRAMNMLMAVRYVQELNEDYRGIIFATGTDIRNSMSDMYTMLRYLAPDVLEASQSESFDSFMGTFGEVVKTVEVNPEGTGYRENSRLSKFTNIPEMVMMYRQVADVLTDAQLNLPKPKVDEINIAADSGEWLKMYMAHLAERAKATRSGSVDNRDDNLLKIANDGRKASLDMRLIDPRIPDDPSSKVNRCVDNVLHEWENGKEDRLTQIVFCDMGVPKKDKFSVYEDIKEKLIQSGIPDSEIAFAQDYKTDAKKKQLESELNAGRIRVVIASTETLGVGSNVQEKLVAQHNLDAPWRPRDLEQRGGRMERPGNTNDVTRRYNYTQSDSFDLFMWETLKRKAAFIQQAKVDPRSAAREIDEDLSPTYSEVMAITTGNPLIRKKIEVDSTVEKLESAERSYKRAQWDNTNQIDAHQGRISSLNQHIEKTETLIGDLQKDKGRIQIGDRIFSDTKEISIKVNKLLKEFIDKNTYAGISKLPIGTIGATPFYLQHRMMDNNWVLKLEDGVNGREVSDLKTVKGKIEALLTFESSLSRDVRWSEREVSRHESAIDSLKEVASKPFTQQEDLVKALEQQKQINADLSESANDEIDKSMQERDRFTDALETIPQRAAKMRVG